MQSDRENTSLRGVRVAIGPRKHDTSRGLVPNPGPVPTQAYFHTPYVQFRLTILVIWSKILPRPLPRPPWHVASRGPGRNRTEKTRHFEGPGSQSDWKNTSLPGVRVALGPRKHATSTGPERNRTDKTRHFEGSRSQSDRENTALFWGPARIPTEKTRRSDGSGSQSGRENTPLRGVRDAIGPREHVTSRGPGCNRTERTRPFLGSGSHSDRENTSLRGDQVALGPRKHVTSTGPAHN